MGKIVEQSVRCRNCGEQLFETSNTPVEARVKCPSCGSTARAFDVKITKSIVVEGHPAGSQKRGGKE